MKQVLTRGNVPASCVTGRRPATFSWIALCACMLDERGDGERQVWAQNASWAPGQLQEHFAKHGTEGPFVSVADYDQAARDTVLAGTPFTYVDRESRAQRMGFYHARSNGFTSLTSDGQRILTYFHPDRRETYVRGLDRSTYR